MKYLLILADGMADYPILELDNKTPLEFANTPYMDKLAENALIGNVKTIPDNFPPGSDVANLSVMGFEPSIYYTGRSPLEAISMGVRLSDSDLAIRCNLVTLSSADKYHNRIMLDYSAGEITNEEANTLINDIQNELGKNIFNFYAGISYRNLAVWSEGVNNQLRLTPPHDILDKQITSYIPNGDNSDLLLDLMVKSNEILENHPVNIKRKAAGKNPANSIWLWGEGHNPALPSFKEKYNINGSVVAAVDLVKGIGISAGLKSITVAGATGAIETNFAGKAQAALDELQNGQDFVYLHIESPDEAGHQGNMAKKIWAIEQIDKEVLGLIYSKIDNFAEIRILLLPDHPTPISVRTHTADPVPFILYDKNNLVNNKLGLYNEKTASEGIFLDSGSRLMDMFIGK